LPQHARNNISTTTTTNGSSNNTRTGAKLAWHTADAPSNLSSRHLTEATVPRSCILESGQRVVTSSAQASRTNSS
jgi:hypothetical protein